MRTGCGCVEIKHEPIEFEITGPVPNLTNCPLILPNTNEEDWCRLKTKVISDFTDIIKKLECGILPDIELLLEEISLIYMNSNCGFGVVKKMYATDPEEDRFLRHNMFLSEFETQEEKDLVLKNLGISDQIEELRSMIDLNNNLSMEDIQLYVNNQIKTVNSNITSSINAEAQVRIESLKSKIGYVYEDSDNHKCYGFSDYSEYVRWKSGNGSYIASWTTGTIEEHTPVTPVTPVVTPTIYYRSATTAFTGNTFSGFNSTTQKTFSFESNNPYICIAIPSSLHLKTVITSTNDTLYNIISSNNSMTSRSLTVNGTLYTLWEYSSIEGVGILNIVIE